MLREPFDMTFFGIKFCSYLSLSLSTAHSAPKRKWESQEVEAIEKRLGAFIKSLRVPGKVDCVTCLEAEPRALKNRDWQAIKYFVYNRIVSLKRKM